MNKAKLRVHAGGFFVHCIFLANPIALVFCHCFRAEAAPVSEAWQKEVSALVWVAYSPTSADPTRGIEPTRVSIESDLAVLRRAKVTGLVTYGSSGIIGRELPAIAEAKGFRGLIIGIWDPKNAAEITTARNAAKSPVVLGYCMGNEGLDERYSLKELAASVGALREATGKPVTTAEQIEDYDNVELLHLGDWVFPTVHPYFHRKLDPNEAVRWTMGAYARLKQKSDRFVLFKEVGLPTAGNSKESLSETNQDKYYSDLAKTSVRFVYFEAFDQPWKKHLPIEPHWGVFRADRSAKILGLRLFTSETPAGGTFPAGLVMNLMEPIFEKIRTGELQKSPDVFNSVLTEIRKQSDSEPKVRDLVIVANALKVFQFEKATEAILNEALRSADKMKDDLPKSSAFAHVAHSLANDGYFDQALSVAERVPDVRMKTILKNQINEMKTKKDTPKSKPKAGILKKGNTDVGRMAADAIARPVNDPVTLLTFVDEDDKTGSC